MDLHQRNLSLPVIEWLEEPPTAAAEEAMLEEAFEDDAIMEDA